MKKNRTLQATPELKVYKVPKQNQKDKAIFDTIKNVVDIYNRIYRKNMNKTDVFRRTRLRDISDLRAVVHYTLVNAAVPIPKIAKLFSVNRASVYHNFYKVRDLNYFEHIRLYLIAEATKLYQILNKNKVKK